MHTTSFTNSQFQRLTKFNPGDKIVNIESELFIIGSARSKQPRKLLKKYFQLDGEYFGMKLKNLNTLMYYKRVLSTIDSLVLPDDVAIVGGKIVGYTMPYIENSVNLQEILKNDKEDPLYKLSLLKKIGEILYSIDVLKGFPYEFRLNDMHEANFVVQNRDTIKVVDIDSSYISNNEFFTSKYLFLDNNLLDYMHKYQIDNDGDIIPSRDSDLYCYAMIFLNTISNSKIYYLDVNDFYNYLNYLETIGFNKSLLYALAKIYSEAPNENILPYLYDLDAAKIYRSHHKVYKQVTGIDIQKKTYFNSQL